MRAKAEKTIRDFLNRKMRVGDTVIFMIVNYRKLSKGIIMRIGERKVTIKNIKDGKRYIQYAEQVIKYKGANDDQPAI